MAVSVEQLLEGIALAKTGDFAGTFELCAKMADASQNYGAAKLYRVAAGEITRLREGLQHVVDVSGHASSADLGAMARETLEHKNGT